MLSFLVKTDRKDEAEALVSQAEASIPPDYRDQFHAQAMQLLGRFDDAERAYLRALREKPNDLDMVRAVSQFYLGVSALRPAWKENAEQLIDRILSEASGDEAQIANLRWARQSKARFIAARRRYTDGGKTSRNVIHRSGSSNRPPTSGSNSGPPTFILVGHRPSGNRCEFKTGAPGPTR